MIYPKGAYILHMLRMMMYDHRQGTGDAKFKAMMQDFLASHYNQDVSTNDFKLAVEKHMLPTMNVDKTGKMDWFFDEWVYGTDMPSYKLNYSVTSTDDGKAIFNGTVTQSGVSDQFVMLVPIYLDFGKGWSYLGSASLVGNSTLEIKNIKLPMAPQKAAVAALQDVLAENIENNKQ